MQLQETTQLLSRHHMSNGCAVQALCFMAGANSIFDGDKLLTTPNNERNADLEMFDELGLKSRPAFMPYAAGSASSNGCDSQPAQPVPAPGMQQQQSMTAAAVA